ncbi:MAG: thermonuclease family protein [Synergistaceae bacterium]|nr:thermonuclease family protein [Synergistaceae bacterium]
MARKKNITIEDLAALGPKKIILLIIAAAVMYFAGGEFVPDVEDIDTGQDTSGIVAGVVARVVDGDTAVIRVDGKERRVRFLGVDTPETVHPTKGVQPYGKEASNFTKDSLNGRQVWLEYDKSPTDRYNRDLAYVWLTKPGRIDDEAVRRNMFNARLLAGGYAKVLIIKPNNRYEKIFKEIQSEAQRTKIGMWQ